MRRKNIEPGAMIWKLAWPEGLLTSLSPAFYVIFKCWGHPVWRIAPEAPVRAICKSCSAMLWPAFPNVSLNAKHFVNSQLQLISASHPSFSVLFLFLFVLTKQVKTRICSWHVLFSLFSISCEDILSFYFIIVHSPCLYFHWIKILIFYSLSCLFGGTLNIL